MSWTNEQIQEAVSKVVEKAAKDSEFRAKVISDVYAAVKEATGRDVPRDFKIQVVTAPAITPTSCCLSSAVRKMN